MADKSKAGKEYPAITWEVERGKIRELAKAIGDFNPIYLDKKAAIAEGYKDTPASLTYLTVPMMFCDTMPGVIVDLQINFAMVLHGEEEYEFYQQIYPGDVLTAIPKVVSIEEKTSKSGRKMDMTTLESVYTNQKGEKVAKAKTVIVERK